MRLLILALAALALANPLPLIETSANAALYDARGKARKEFRALWTERFNGYVERNASLAQAHKTAVEAFNSRPFDFAPGDNRFDAFYEASLQDARNSGRGKLLEAFLKRTDGKPSIGILLAWLQAKSDEGRQKWELAEAHQAETQALLKRPNARLRDLIIQSEKTAMAQGEALGHQEELALLIDNFKAYSGDMAEADAKDADRRRRIAAALGAMGKAMQGYGANANPGWTATCSRVGDFVTCSGR